MSFSTLIFPSHNVTIDTSLIQCQSLLILELCNYLPLPLGDVTASFARASKGFTFIKLLVPFCPVSPKASFCRSFAIPPCRSDVSRLVFVCVRAPPARQPRQHVHVCTRDVLLPDNALLANEGLLYGTPSLPRPSPQCPPFVAKCTIKDTSLATVRGGVTPIHFNPLLSLSPSLPFSYLLFTSLHLFFLPSPAQLKKMNLSKQPRLPGLKTPGSSTTTPAKPLPPSEPTPPPP